MQCTNTDETLRHWWTWDFTLRKPPQETSWRLHLRCMEPLNYLISQNVTSGPNCELKYHSLLPTEVERGIPFACVVVDVGDAKGLDGDSSDAQQQLTQEQHGVDPLLGRGLLFQAGLIVGWGGDWAFWLAEVGTFFIGGCLENRETLLRLSEFNTQISFSANKTEREKIQSELNLFLIYWHIS